MEGDGGKGRRERKIQGKIVVQDDDKMCMINLVHVYGKARETREASKGKSEGRQ